MTLFLLSGGKGQFDRTTLNQLHLHQRATVVLVALAHLLVLPILAPFDPSFHPLCRAHWNIERQIVDDVGNQEDDTHGIVPDRGGEHDPCHGDVDDVEEGVEVATEGRNASDGKDSKGDA